MATAIDIALDGYTLAIAAASNALASLNTPTDDPVRKLWNERLSDYLRRRAAYDANFEFGSHMTAELERDETLRNIEERYGKAYRTIPEAKAEADASWKKYLDADVQETETFLLPVWAAARALAETPAPDLASTMLKIELIKREETWNDRDFKGDAMANITADLARAHAMGL